MFASNVAPRRRVKPAPKPWTCVCHEYGKPDHPDAAGGMQPRYVNRRQPAHLTVCPDCHTRRDTADVIEHVFLSERRGIEP